MKNIKHYALLALAVIPNTGQSSPMGGTVTNGTATINQSGTLTTINQATNNATINWNSFDVASSETVNFIQPSAQSATLNNISGLNPSTIAGSITSNGRVFLSNPNGFVFTNSSTVNVGSLLTTTSSISDGSPNTILTELSLSNNGTGTITADGNITSGNDGFIAFFAPSINNRAALNSPSGDIALSNASNGTLYLPNSAGIGFSINSLNSLNAVGIENSGTISAKGGQVILSSSAIDQTLKSAINNTGIIDVSAISTDGGAIRILATNGSINQSANLNANAGDNGNGGDIIIIAKESLIANGHYSSKGGSHSGNGGFIETSGLKEITALATVDTQAPFGTWGTWLIDPVNLTISSDPTSANNQNVDDLTNQLLSNGNIQLDASSNLTVLSAINSTGPGTLTLKAPTIEIQKNIIVAGLTIDGAFVILSADLTAVSSILFNNTASSAQQDLLLARDSNISVSNGDITFTNSRTYGDNNSLTLTGNNIYIDTVDGIASLMATSSSTGSIFLNNNIATRGDGITLAGGDIKLTGVNDVTLTTFNTGNINLSSAVVKNASQPLKNLSFKVADGELNLQAISGINNLAITNNSVLTTLNGNIDITGTFSSNTTSNINLNGSLTVKADGGIDTSDSHLKTQAADSITNLESLADISLGEFDSGSLNVTSNKLTLNNDINTSTTLANSLNFANATAIELNQDVTLTGNIFLKKDDTTVVGINSKAGSPARSLTIVGGSHDVTLGKIGNTTALQSFSLTGTGSLTLDATAPAPITSGSNGISFLGSLDLGSIAAFTIDTSANNGNINLSGLNIDTAAISLKAGSGDISLGTLGKTTAITSLITNTSGAINLHGNINNAENLFDFSSASSINLHENITFGTEELSVASLLFGDAAIDGNFDLNIKADVLSIGAVGQNIALQNLTINTGEAALTLNNNINTAGDISLSGGLVTLNNDTSTTGGNVSVSALTGLSMSQSSKLSAQDGSITLAATEGDISVGALTSLSSITINATAGSVLNGINDYNSNADTSINLTSKEVIVTSGKGIGSDVDSPIVIKAGSEGSIKLTTAGKAYISNISNAKVTSNKEIIDNTSQSFVATTDALNQLKIEPQDKNQLTELAISDPIWQKDSNKDSQQEELTSAPRIYYSKKGWRLGNP